MLPVLAELNTNFAAEVQQRVPKGEAAAPLRDLLPRARPALVLSSHWACCVCMD